MRTTKILFGAALLSVAVTGCAARARVYAATPAVYAESTPVYNEPVYNEPAYNEPVVYEEPPLVAIEPEVYVVYDYSVPVYWVGGFYWRYEGGIWYRSAAWSGGWVTVHLGTVPQRIVYRDHRHYVRYAPTTATVYRTHATMQGNVTIRRPVVVNRASVRARVRPAPPVHRPGRQVTPPGHVRQRAVPAPRYNEPVQRQRVRGREVTPPPRKVPPPRRDDRRNDPRGRGRGQHPEHPHGH